MPSAIGIIGLVKGTSSRSCRPRRQSSPQPTWSDVKAKAAGFEKAELLERVRTLGHKCVYGVGDDMDSAAVVRTPPRAVNSSKK